jgi:tetratricopeptide (TPR) repeat protein
VRAADWAEVERAADASASLAEAEGLVGKLCLANLLRGSLSRHQQRYADARDLFETAHALAAEVGWSEASLSGLMGLASVLSDMGDLTGARAALLEARAVCERAGLLPQSVQANAELAAVCLRIGDADAARDAAAMALEDSSRVHDAASVAAARQAQAVLAQLGQA